MYVISPTPPVNELFGQDIAYYNMHVARNFIFSKHLLFFFGVLTPLSTIFQLYHGDHGGGGSRSTRREPPTMGKQLVNFITCGCERQTFLLYLLLPTFFNGH
jgi:hypothetical protein